MSKFYITNAIAYVNGAPHIGHALEMLQGDALARYHRLKGDETYFLVGTDEHGTKIFKTATDQGKTAQELADQNSKLFQDMHEAFGASHDDFIRTTSERHKAGAQKLWKLLEAADVLYEKEYEGLYCSGCETFLQSKDLEDGLCVHHQRAPEVVKEKNIFFRLSDFSDEIKRLIETNEFLIRPESRRNEILALLEEGLKDVSFSRPNDVLPWGIPVPGREDQMMYVWCDALTNYISALGFAEDAELFKKFWPADVHLVGKDITRFHCAIWPGMLLAAGLPLPKAVYVHGFVTSEGMKMSKSIGNVVDPMEALEQWGLDPLRYYLLREIPTADDGDFSKERFHALYQDELQNTFGNLIRRVLAMTQKYFDGRLVEGDGHFDEQLKATWAAYEENFEAYNIKKALEAVVQLAREANAYIEEQKPWELAKSDQDQLAVVLGNLLVLCRSFGDFLLPVIPDSAEKIRAHFKEDHIELGEALFPRLEQE